MWWFRYCLNNSFHCGIPSHFASSCPDAHAQRSAARTSFRGSGEGEGPAEILDERRCLIWPMGWWWWWDGIIMDYKYIYIYIMYILYVYMTIHVYIDIYVCIYEYIYRYRYRSPWIVELFLQLFRSLPSPACCFPPGWSCIRRSRWGHGGSQCGCRGWCSRPWDSWELQQGTCRQKCINNGAM